MEVLQADGAVKYLLHYAESDLIIVITESMVIGQFAIEEDGGINEVSRQSFLTEVTSKYLTTRKYLLRGYILGVPTHTTAWDQLWGDDETVTHLVLKSNKHTVMLSQCYTPSKEKRRFLYFNHLSKEFLELMIPHLKALI